MVVGIPDITNSSWRLTYKKDKDALERFESAETINSEKKPKSGKKEAKRKKETDHERALRETKESRNDPEAKRRQERGAEQYRMEDLKERTDDKRRGKETKDTTYQLNRESDEHPSRGTSSARGGGSKASATIRNFPKGKDPETGKTRYENNEVNEKNIKRLGSKVEEAKRRQSISDANAKQETENVENQQKREGKRSVPNLHLPKDQKDNKGNTQRVVPPQDAIERHEKEINAHRSAQLKTPKKDIKPKTDPWAKLPEEARVTNEKPVSTQVEERSKPIGGDEEGYDMYSTKSIQILKTLVKVSRLRRSVRKDRELAGETDAWHNQPEEIKERLRNPISDTRDIKEQNNNPRTKIPTTPSKDLPNKKTPRKFIPRKDGGTLSEGGARVPKKQQNNEKIDPIGTKDSRLSEIRANIRQRRTIRDTKREVTNPKTGKKITETVPAWDKQVAEKERKRDTERFTGDKIGNAGVSADRKKLIGSKGKQIFDKLDGRGQNRAESQSGRTEEEMEVGRQKRIEAYRKTESDKQSESDSFKKGLKGGAKRKYETSDDKGKEAMFKKWKRSQGQKKKSDDIADRLKNLNL
jgi:hypothetical protein|tara:strand:+ start:6016 stop:7764 length:1749 start_codon:yes stop_codon:yes gene_type:complete